MNQTQIQTIEENKTGCIFIEIWGIYDGWSIKRLRDGTLINRWNPETDPGKYLATQKWIDKFGKGLSL